MTQCAWDYYYSDSTERCEPCENLCATDSSSKECALRCPDYVARLSRQSSVTPTLTQGSQSLPTYWFVVVTALSIAVVLAVILLIACVRRCLSPAGKYATVQDQPNADPALQGLRSDPSPSLAPALPCRSAREESTDAATSSAAGSHKHRYAPTRSSQNPFDGFQTTYRDSPV